MIGNVTTGVADHCPFPKNLTDHKLQSNKYTLRNAPHEMLKFQGAWEKTTDSNG